VKLKSNTSSPSRSFRGRRPRSKQPKEQLIIDGEVEIDENDYSSAQTNQHKAD